MQQKKPAFCHLCGKKLSGPFFVYDEKLVVCERCNTVQPRCNQCNIPSLQLTPVRGKLICPRCLAKAPVCPCCHLPILDKYFLVGDSPVKYCETCVNTRPRCDICRVPINETGKVFQGRDGSTINRCGSCLSTAVSAPGVANQLYRETFALLQNTLLLRIPSLPALHLVERSELIALNRQAGASELPGTDTPLGPEHQHLLGFFQRIDEQRDIYIERILPQALFQAVAAHELTHAWQSFYAPSTQPLLIVEGFAEWVAYRVLVALNYQREAARLTRRSSGDVYGDGLQYFIQLERQNGREAVLQRAQQP